MERWGAVVRHTFTSWHLWNGRRKKTMSNINFLISLGFVQGGEGGCLFVTESCTSGHRTRASHRTIPIMMQMNISPVSASEIRTLTPWTKNSDADADGQIWIYTRPNICDLTEKTTTRAKNQTNIYSPMHVACVLITHFRWISFRVLPREIFFWSTRSSTTPVVALFWPRLLLLDFASNPLTSVSLPT